MRPLLEPIVCHFYVKVSLKNLHFPLFYKSGRVNRVKMSQLEVIKVPLSMLFAWQTNVLLCIEKAKKKRMNERKSKMHKKRSKLIGEYLKFTK